MAEPRERKTLFQRAKRFLPVSLFGRALLILLVPMVLVQVIAIYIFYDRHWSSMTRNLSASLAGEVAILVQEVQFSTGNERNYRKELMKDLMNVDITFTPRNSFTALEKHDPRFHELSHQLQRRIAFPFSIRQVPPEDNILVQVQMYDSTLNVLVGKKRLVSSTTYIFILWMIGSAVITLGIAVLFLRNQIRPITQLAKVSDAFGRGQDVGEFRPSGAREIRQAGRAFLTMRSRIMRQVETRTAMLNAISHDLRTPLTRLKLQLEMQPETTVFGGMRKDIDEMQSMIQEYLDFAKGAEGEESQSVLLLPFLQETVDPFVRNSAAVLLLCDENPAITIRPRHMRRVLDNLITNALRYGKECTVRALMLGGNVVIYVEDKGPGIPEDQFEEVFKPFRRLEPSRNFSTGGAGLGLSIARDIVQAHGGDITLKNSVSDMGEVRGLQVRVRLPYERAIES